MKKVSSDVDNRLADHINTPFWNGIAQKARMKTRE